MAVNIGLNDLTLKPGEQVGTAQPSCPEVQVNTVALEINSQADIPSLPWEKVNVNPDLDAEQMAAVRQLLQRHRSCIALSPNELGCTSLVEHSIDTGDSRPIHQSQRRFAPFKRSVIQTQVKDMIQQGVVVPSSSPWSSPVVLVRKKYGTIRFCVDYRKINSLTKQDVWAV